MWVPQHNKQQKTYTIDHVTICVDNPTIKFTTKSVVRQIHIILPSSSNKVSPSRLLQTDF